MTLDALALDTTPRRLADRAPWRPGPPDPDIPDGPGCGGPLAMAAAGPGMLAEPRSAGLTQGRQHAGHYPGGGPESLRCPRPDDPDRSIGTGPARQCREGAGISRRRDGRLIVAGRESRRAALSINRRRTATSQEDGDDGLDRFRRSVRA
jgi:hypothetical protein